MGWKKRERTILNHLPRKPGTMLDVGVGNKSEYWVVHKAYPHCVHIGLEPDPAMAGQILLGQVSYQGVPAAPGYPGLLLPYAAWSSCRMLHRQQMRVSPNPPGDKVPAVTLDLLAKRIRMPSPVLLWMDCEGAELEALRGGTSLLARVYVVNVEVRPRAVCPDTAWCSQEEVHEFLNEAGFRLICEYGHMPREQGGHHDAIYSR
jgi:FkbM family methyltransferase